MSRGLGSLQRAILEAVRNAERQRQREYQGSGAFRKLGHPMPKNQGNRWVKLNGDFIQLAVSVADLLEVANSLARRRNGIDKYGGTITGGFRATFSRAVRGLLASGHIVAPRMVPVERVDPYFPLKQPDQVLDTADGLFIWQPRRPRFVMDGKH